MSDAAGRRILVVGSFAGMLVAALAGPGRAQPVDLLANPTSATLPGPGVVDFEVGRVEYAGTVQLLVEPKNSNRVWYLYVRSDDASMGGYGKPVDDLLWRIQGAGAWNPLDPVDQLVATGTGNDSILLEVAVALDWALDVPDTYASDLLFRVGHDP